MRKDQGLVDQLRCHQPNCSTQQEGFVNRLIRAMVVLAVVGTLGGCTAAQIGSAPSATPIATPAAESPTAVPTATPTAEPAPTVTPEPTAEGTPDPALPSPVPVTYATPAPGEPSTVDWTAIGPPKSGTSALTLFGWSGGYVTFGFDFEALKAVPYVSNDGKTWAAGSPLDLRDLTAGLPAWRQELKSWDADMNSPDESTCLFMVDNFAHGPSNLLMTGWFDCAAPCGRYFIGPASWTSPDGLTWARAPKISDLPRVSGGSSGFVAIAAGTNTISTSKNGQSWTKSTVPLPTGAGGVTLNSEAAFAGGFVIAGSVSYGHGCAYAGDGTIYKASIWHSSDGKTWSQDTISASLACGDATVKLYRLSDVRLVAIEQCSDKQVTAAWTSSDGVNWTQAQIGDTIGLYDFYTDGRTNVGFAAYANDPAHTGRERFCYLNASGEPVALRSTGDAINWDNPDHYFVVALGPAGVLLLANDDKQAWLGSIK